jgi:hypothetical protein
MSTHTDKLMSQIGTVLYETAKGIGICIVVNGVLFGLPLLFVLAVKTIFGV